MREQWNLLAWNGEGWRVVSSHASKDEAAEAFESCEEAPRVLASGRNLHEIRSYLRRQNAKMEARMVWASDMAREGLNMGQEPGGSMSQATTAVTRTRRGPASLSPSQMGGSSGKRFAPHPDGKHVARCVDVLDLGEEEFKGKTRHRLSFVFATDQQDEEGEPKLIQHYVTTSLFGGDPSQGISPSGHMKMLREILGMPGLTQDQLRRKNDDGEESYNTAKMVGRVCTINVIHRTSASGRDYANIAKFGPAAPEDADKPLALDDYYRPDFLHKRTVEAQTEVASGPDPFAGSPAPVSEAVERELQPADGDANLPPGVTSADAEVAAERSAIQSESAPVTQEDAPF